jgi:hypothetical protein
MKCFVLILLIVSQISFSQTKFNIEPRIGARHCESLIKQEDPLIVVDGIPVLFDELAKINPNDIISINILNASEIRCSDPHPVIIITTKKSLVTEIAITDFLTGKPIVSASISFISKDKKDSFLFVANDSGCVITERLKRNVDYDVTVSSIGYKSFSAAMKIKVGGKTKISLEPNYIACKEVIVSDTLRRRRCYCPNCRYKIIRYSDITTDIQVKQDLKLYPNPAFSKSILHLELIQNAPGYFYLQLFNASGQNVFNKEVYLDVESKLLSIDLPSLETGNYFVKLTNKDTGKFFTSKLMIK